MESIVLLLSRASFGLFGPYYDLIHADAYQDLVGAHYISKGRHNLIKN